MRVEHVMRRGVRTCTPSDTLNVPAKNMLEEDCGCVPVVLGNGDGGHHVAGMITDRDICMAACTRGLPLDAMRTGDVMSSDVASCRATDAVNVALKIMETKQLHRLPVMDEHDRLIGIIALADLAREARRQQASWANPITAADIGEAVQRISLPPGGSREVAPAA